MKNILTIAIMTVMAAGAHAEGAFKTLAESVPGADSGFEITVPAADKAVAVETERANKSVYTSLKNGKEIYSDESDTVIEYRGTAGYKLRVLSFDIRESVDVVYPDGRTQQLNYIANVTSAFSYVGKVAEWRVSGNKPVALITRLNASEDPDNPSKETSYLVVSKITPQQACVVAKIAPSADQNELARKAADSAQEMPCVSNR